MAQVAGGKITERCKYACRKKRCHALAPDQDIDRNGATDDCVAKLLRSHAPENSFFVDPTPTCEACHGPRILSHAPGG
jgi:hypothetical protein